MGFKIHRSVKPQKPGVCITTFLFYSTVVNLNTAATLMLSVQSSHAQFPSRSVKVNVL